MARVDVVTSRFGSFINSVFGTDFEDLDAIVNHDEASFNSQLEISARNREKFAMYYRAGKFGEWTVELEPTVLVGQYETAFYREYSGAMDQAIDRLAQVLSRAVDLCPDPNAMAIICPIPRAGSNFYGVGFLYRMTKPAFSTYLGPALREHGFTGNAAKGHGALSAVKLGMALKSCTSFNFKKTPDGIYLPTFQNECLECPTTAYSFRGRNIEKFIVALPWGPRRMGGYCYAIFQQIVLIRKDGSPAPPQQPPTGSTPSSPPGYTPPEIPPVGGGVSGIAAACPPGQIGSPPYCFDRNVAFIVGGAALLGLVLILMD